MKLISLLILSCALVTAPFVQTGCKTPPNERVIQAKTLISVGQTAEAALVLSASLYRDGLITAVQARQAFDFFNDRFVPAFRLAKAAALSDMSSLAPAELVALATQLTILVSSFTKP